LILWSGHSSTGFEFCQQQHNSIVERGISIIDLAVVNLDLPRLPIMMKAKQEPNRVQRAFSAANLNKKLPEVGLGRSKSQQQLGKFIA
jgi:hypothetical protein